MPGWVKISVDDTCHVVWQVKRRGTEPQFLHAIGEGPEGNRVTEEMAAKRFEAGVCKTPWLPVLFPDRTIMTGDRSHNCVTAASRALWRGWFYRG
jgi:hypothetical protein